MTDAEVDAIRERDKKWAPSPRGKTNAGQAAQDRRRLLMLVDAITNRWAADVAQLRALQGRLK